MSPDDPQRYDACNPYSRIIIDAAVRRGLDVEILDAAAGQLRISDSQRSMTTFESLSELTSAVAFRIADDKALTRRSLERQGIPIPAGRIAQRDGSDIEMLDRGTQVVVKPTRGEGGRGITVGVRDARQLEAAVDRALTVSDEVLIEEMVPGDDLRVLVIGGRVAAAAVRRPATVTGNGVDDLATLIEDLSTRRAAQTGGSSTVPLDDVTLDVLSDAGLQPGSVLPDGRELRVRRTANLHTGGTIEDVTARLHPDLAATALRATEIIGLPVAGIDLIVEQPDAPAHVVIEVNEQPGLANHEPQPTAELFIDLLFPHSR